MTTVAATGVATTVRLRGDRGAVPRATPLRVTTVVATAAVTTVGASAPRDDAAGTAAATTVGLGTA